MRQYEHIWERLKKEHKVIIRTPSYNFFTLVNMVKKEKYKDIVYKLQCAEQDTEAKMKIERNYNKEEIVFKLIKYKRISLRGLKG